MYRRNAGAAFARSTRRIALMAAALALVLASLAPDAGALSTADTVTLHSVAIANGQVSVTYSKNFTTCAHLLAANAYTPLHAQNLFCTTGNNITVNAPVASFTGLQVGSSVRLCHGNNYSICSANVTVSGTNDTVTLQSVVITNGQVEVTYSKSFSTCAHLLAANAYNPLHAQNLFCTTGNNVRVTAPATSFSGLQVGGSVRLCHGNNYSVCSANVTVSAGAVTLARAEIVSGNVVVTYSKNFATCAHLVRASNLTILHSKNIYCGQGTNLTVTEPLTSFSGLTAGTSVRLCHGNNYGICSSPLNVTTR